MTKIPNSDQSQTQVGITSQRTRSLGHAGGSGVIYCWPVTAEYRTKTASLHRKLTEDFQAYMSNSNSKYVLSNFFYLCFQVLKCCCYTYWISVEYFERKDKENCSYSWDSMDLCYGMKLEYINKHYISCSKQQLSLLELSTLKYLSAQSLLKDARNTLGSEVSVSVAEAWKTEVPRAEFSNTLMEVGRFVKSGSSFISEKKKTLLNCTWLQKHGHCKLRIIFYPFFDCEDRCIY
jgi:hypothetical protein